jgi:hypothetical protein
MDLKGLDFYVSVSVWSVLILEVINDSLFEQLERLACSGWIEGS